MRVIVQSQNSFMNQYIVMQIFLSITCNFLSCKLFYNSSVSRPVKEMKLLNCRFILLFYEKPKAFLHFAGWNCQRKLVTIGEISMSKTAFIRVSVKTRIKILSPHKLQIWLDPNMFLPTQRMATKYPLTEYSYPNKTSTTADSDMGSKAKRWRWENTGCYYSDSKSAKSYFSKKTRLGIALNDDHTSYVVQQGAPTIQPFKITLKTYTAGR